MPSSARALIAGVLAAAAYLGVATTLQLTLGNAPPPSARLAGPWLAALLGLSAVMGVVAGALLALFAALWRRADQRVARTLLGLCVWLVVAAALVIASRETIGISQRLMSAVYGSLALLVIVPGLAPPTRALLARLAPGARRGVGLILVVSCLLPLLAHLRFADLYPGSHVVGAVLASVVLGAALLFSSAPLPGPRVVGGAVVVALCAGAVFVVDPPFGLSPRLHLIPPVHGALAAAASFAPDRDQDGYRTAWGLAPVADCDDEDPLTRPAAVDLPGDGKDQNCFAGDVDKDSRVLAEVCADRQVRCEGPREESPRETSPREQLPRNIVFLTLDALNYQEGHPGGIDPELTPFLSSLLDDSLAADAYRSCATSTTTSTDLNWSGVDLRLQKGAHKSIVGLLAREHGYRTYELSALLMPPGRVGHAWDVWDGEGVSGYEPRKDAEIRDRALEQLQSAEAPFFLHLHLLSLHAPREPVPPCTGADDAAAIYDCLLTRLDGYVRDIVLELWRRHGKERSLVVIQGDHGENLEHEHASSLREEIVHTPLLFVDGRGARVVKGPAGCRDILPTTFDLAGLCSPDVRGPSLARRDPPPDRAQLMLIGYPTPSPPSLLRYGIRRGKDKLTLDFASGSLMAWNVLEDPREERGTLVYDHPLVGELDAWMSLHRASLLGTDLCPPLP